MKSVRWTKDGGKDQYGIKMGIERKYEGEGRGGKLSAEHPKRGK